MHPLLRKNVHIRWILMLHFKRILKKRKRTSLKPGHITMVALVIISHLAIKAHMNELVTPLLGNTQQNQIKLQEKTKMEIQIGLRMLKI